MEKWLKWAMEIQSMAQAGLTYTDNVYDIESNYISFNDNTIKKDSKEVFVTNYGKKQE